MTAITCHPHEALRDASFSILNGAMTPQHRAPRDEPWETEVRVGAYTVRASFTGGRYRDASSHNVIFYPPFVPHSVTIEP
jgi:hypothetical protein